MGRIAGIVERVRVDVALAVLFTVVAELEVLLGPSEADSVIRALLVPVGTVPLVWRRRMPLLPLAALAAVLLVQAAALDGFMDDPPVALLAALVLALYSAGRHAGGTAGLAGAVAAMVVLIATRTVFDPAIEGVGDVALTAGAVPLPFLVGRWVRNQSLLRRELEEKTERLARERARDVRHAAEEERMRIASDLQAAVAGGLTSIIGLSRELPSVLRGGDPEDARRRFTTIADTAREALADVRRVLGILRRDGQAPRLAPGEAPRELTARSEGWVATPRGEAEAEAPGEVEPETRLPLVSPATLDRLIVVALLIVAQVELALIADGGEWAAAAIVALAIPTPLLWRRHHPVIAGAAVLAAVAVQSAVADVGRFPAADILSLICASYAIGAYAERREAVIGLVIMATGGVAHALAFNPDAVAMALLGGSGVPWTVGRIARGVRDLRSETGEKAEQIERSRAQDARLAVTGERMRVARELHDAVAHNLSVLAIQAAGGDGIVDRDPERAADIARLIEAVALEAQDELGRLLGPVRTGEAGAAGVDGPVGTAPDPTLARLDGLAQRARDAGLPVEVRIEGQPAAIPAGIDLAAFRIVQEALANTSKHAGAARAWVVVRYEPRAVEVEIGDDGRGPNGNGASRDGTGHGLIGMRERVALYGGTLQTGRGERGGFEVRARLPLGPV